MPVSLPLRADRLLIEGIGMRHEARLDDAERWTGGWASADGRAVPARERR